MASRRREHADHLGGLHARALRRELDRINRSRDPRQVGEGRKQLTLTPHAERSYSPRAVVVRRKDVTHMARTRDEKSKRDAERVKQFQASPPCKSFKRS